MNNQLIALSKEEHAELNSQETERAEESLINILLGLHGYMMGESEDSGGRRETVGAELWRGSQYVGSVTMSAKLWPA